MFRCDISWVIGTGHFTRLYSIAEYFILQNWEVYFCGDFSEPNWIKPLFDQNNKIKTISKIEGLNLNQKFDVVVIDSYTIEQNEINSFFSKCNLRVVLIDTATPLSEADLYFSALPVNDLSISRGDLYHGKEYALIRNDIKEFKKIRNEKNSNKKNKIISIFSGGAAKQEFINVLIPQIYPFLKNWQIKIFSKRFVDNNLIKYENIEFIEPVHDFYNHLQDTDLILTSASVSLWEFVFLETPIAVYGIYPNQKDLYYYFEKNKYSIGVGYTSKVVKFQIDSKKFSELCFSIEKNTDRKPVNNLKIDGLGSERIFKIIERYVKNLQ